MTSTVLDDGSEQGSVPTPTGMPDGWRSRIGNRRWPCASAFLMMVTGLLFMVLWFPVVHHQQTWYVGADLWGMVRGAHYVGWGFLGGIYVPSNGIITFPGLPVLLAPAAILSGGLHLSESYSPIFLAHPTAALILQPIELLLASSVVFASDALAEHLEVSRKRRACLCIVIAVVAWPTAALWGHAEDALAMSFALYGLIACLDKKWAKCGWLLGLGIVVQPLVALLLPLLIASIPRARRFMIIIRSLTASGLLIGVAIAGNATDTLRALLQQPTPPSVNHATPWVALSPQLNRAPEPVSHVSAALPRSIPSLLDAVTTTGREVIVVAGGAGRILDVAFAVLLGLYVWRRPQPAIRLVWLAAVVLASRCFFEPVMTPYYLAPPLFLCLVLAARQRGKRFWPASIIALEITVFAYHHLNPWLWWLPVVAGLGAIVALGYPGGIKAETESPEDSFIVAEESDGDPALEQIPVVAPVRAPAFL